MRSVVLVATLLTGSAAPAAADPPFSSLYVFGDSLSDDGNIPDVISAQNPDLPIGFPVSPPYSDFRFSNGPTYAEQLAPLLGLPLAPQDNFAVGGAFAGDANTSDDLVEKLSGGTVELPGVAEQINAFVASGGRFDEHALVTVYAGSNDYFSVPDLANATEAELSASVAATIGDLEADIRALAEAGARTILVPNVVDLGRTPLYLGSDSAAAASTLASLHNDALNASLEALAEELGIELVVADFSAGFDLLLSDPARFGLSNVTDPCVESAVESLPPYVLPGEVCSPQELAGSLFFDTVHPTSAGHALLAGYAADTLMGPAFVASEAELALRAGDDFLRGMNSALGAGMVGIAPAEQGRSGEMRVYSVFVSAGGSLGEGSFDAGGADFDYRIASVAGGILFDPMETLRLGVIGGYDRGEAEQEGPGGTAELGSFRLGAMASYDAGRLFGSVGVAYGFDSYDLDRQTYVPELSSTAGTDGGTAGAFVEAGYRFATGGVNFGPVAALRYSDTRIDAYEEAGAPGLDMLVEAQDAQALIASAGFAAATAFATGGANGRGWLSATLEGNLLDGDRSIDTALVTVPDVSRGLAVVPAAGMYGRLAAGASLAFSPRISAGIDAESTIGRAGGDDHAVSGSLTVRF